MPNYRTRPDLGMPEKMAFLSVRIGVETSKMGLALAAELKWITVENVQTRVSM